MRRVRPAAQGVVQLEGVDGRGRQRLARARIHGPRSKIHGPRSKILHRVLVQHSRVLVERRRFRRADTVRSRRARAGMTPAVVLVGQVDWAPGQPRLARPVDLLVLLPLHQVQVPLAVAAGVPADEAGLHHLGQFGLKVVFRVAAAHRPQLAVDLRGLVGQAAEVVGDGGHALEGALGGKADLGQRLGLVCLRLVRADTGQASPPFTVVSS